MKVIKDCLKLQNKKLSRNFNEEEAVYYRTVSVKGEEFVYYKLNGETRDEEGNPYKIPLHTWLSWPLFDYRTVTKLLNEKKSLEDLSILL